MNKGFHWIILITITVKASCIGAVGTVYRRPINPYRKENFAPQPLFSTDFFPTVPSPFSLNEHGFTSVEDESYSSYQRPWIPIRTRQREATNIREYFRSPSRDQQPLEPITRAPKQKKDFFDIPVRKSIQVSPQNKNIQTTGYIRLKASPTSTANPSPTAATATKESTIQSLLNFTTQNGGWRPKQINHAVSEVPIFAQTSGVGFKPFVRKDKTSSSVQYLDDPVAILVKSTFEYGTSSPESEIQREQSSFDKSTNIATFGLKNVSDNKTENINLPFFIDTPKFRFRNKEIDTNPVYFEQPLNNHVVNPGELPATNTVNLKLPPKVKEQGIIHKSNNSDSSLITEQEPDKTYFHVTVVSSDTNQQKDVERSFSEIPVPTGVDSTEIQDDEIYIDSKLPSDKLNVDTNVSQEGPEMFQSYFNTRNPSKSFSSNITENNYFNTPEEKPTSTHTELENTNTKDNDVSSDVFPTVQAGDSNLANHRLSTDFSNLIAPKPTLSSFVTRIFDSSESDASAIASLEGAGSIRQFNRSKNFVLQRNPSLLPEITGTNRNPPRKPKIRITTGMLAGILIAALVFIGFLTGTMVYAFHQWKFGKKDKGDRQKKRTPGYAPEYLDENFAGNTYIHNNIFLPTPETIDDRNQNADNDSDSAINAEEVPAAEETSPKLTIELSADDESGPSSDASDDVIKESDVTSIAQAQISRSDLAES